MIGVHPETGAVNPGAGADHPETGAASGKFTAIPTRAGS